MKESNSKNIIENLNEELKKYKFKLQSRVKFEDVDAYGVVHNVKYFYWLEWARTEYFREIGIEFNNGTFINNFLMMVVHNESDYFAPAHFNDEYEIWTRLIAVKKSSFIFENIICLKNGTILVKSKAVFVYLNNNSIPEPVPDYLREKIKNYEKDNVQMMQ